MQGRLTGQEAAQQLFATSSALQAEIDDARSLLVEARGRHADELTVPSNHYAPTGKKEFVCFCEDVTVKDIVQAIGEGFDDIQLLKRYSTATMGPCQGKMCHKALAGLCARYTGQSAEAIGVTTSRPPLEPVPLGALAGPSHMPMKRSPLDRIHRELGADMVESGPWQRPRSYGSPDDECLAVRQRVGIIDVSTLGKMDVRGQRRRNAVRPGLHAPLLQSTCGQDPGRGPVFGQRDHPGRRDGCQGVGQSLLRDDPLLGTWT